MYHRLASCFLVTSFSFTTLGAIVTNTTATNSTDCLCGYYDPTTGEVFTNSIIVYFNETSDWPDSLVVESFEHKYEQNWNVLYREVASGANVQIQNSSSDSNSSLELYVSPPTSNHIVVSGSIRSARQDIQFGSIRALMRPPQAGIGGSAMSMTMEYNETESITFNAMNTDNPANARVSTLLHSEFPSPSLSVNFSTLEAYSLTNNTPSPWDYNEFRVDWTHSVVKYYIGDLLVRSVSRDEDRALPSTPAPVVLKHWSLGDTYAEQGPPTRKAEASVRWVRMFFNSSLMTKEDHLSFDSTCHGSLKCSMNDTTLRGSTPYISEATTAWKEPPGQNFLRLIPAWICAGCIILTIFLLAHALMLRKLASISKEPKESVDYSDQSQLTPAAGVVDSTGHNTGTTTSLSAVAMDGDDLNTQKLNDYSSHNSQDGGSMTAWRSTGSNSKSITLDNYSATAEHLTKGKTDLLGIVTALEPNKAKDSTPELKPDLKVSATSVITSIKPRKRVDHLAGLVAFSCMAITVQHFGFTFIPALMYPNNGINAHYESEVWANKTIGPFLLNQIFIGIFFTTSCRFLVVRYLESGDLIMLAEKITGRTYRLIIPIAVIAMLEYFLIECGAIEWLEMLPSITWSSWPYTIAIANFGTYLDEVLELAFLIPNAVPQITFNYCTGILWTIPVQLQGSWTTILAVIVVYEIKRPWKRFLYYAACISVNWYALNWGSYFWAGLLIADLDITFKYRKWLLSRSLPYYTLMIFYTICIFLSLSQDSFEILLSYYFNVAELDVHPDILTGLPIQQTPRAGSVEYYVPRVNGLVFSIAAQGIVELSPFIRKVFSSKVILWAFPHVYTIYLIHGFVFWSLGAWLCVVLSGIGLPYWANLLVVGPACYAVIILSLPLVTPVVEDLGINVVKLIWRDAYEQPPKRRATLFPFPRDLLAKYDVRL
jgi:Glycosyl hydrolases family 16